MLNIYRFDENDNLIKGIGLPAFIHNGSYHQITIEVYEDGIIDCWDLVTLDGFKAKVAEGWVVTQVPKGEEISCHHLFYGTSQLKCYIEIDDFVKEVEDTLNRLQGKETSTEKCLQAFSRFLNEPNDINRKKLKSTYLAVPSHLRRYMLGDMDLKDAPIRICIENDKLKPETIADYKEWYLSR
jgi:hypothetical protein